MAFLMEKERSSGPTLLNSQDSGGTVVSRTVIAARHSVLNHPPALEGQQDKAG
jgi:hypothetical protein